MVGIGFIDNSQTMRSTQTPNHNHVESTTTWTDINNNIIDVDTSLALDKNIIRGSTKAENTCIVDGHYIWPQSRDLFMEQPIDNELVAKARDLLRKECEALEDFELTHCQVHYDELMNDEPAASCWRYIIYNDLNSEKSVEVMKKALVWRKENKVADLDDKMFVKEFWHWAPIGFTGKSKEGHDVMFVVGSQYKKPDQVFRQTIRNFVTHMIWKWDRIHRKDLSQMVLVFDTTNTGLSNIDLDFTAWLATLVDYLPARIAAVYVVGIPFIVRPLIKLIISWLPERFRRLIHCGSFDELVRGNMDDNTIPVDVGGTCDESYRISPIEAPWLEESPIANDTRLMKAIKDSICFNISEDRLETVRQLQIDHENMARFLRG